MSDITFIPNPGFVEELRASVVMNAAVARIAAKIATEAEAAAAKYGYVAEVEVTAGDAKVSGSTTKGQGIQDLAGWLEFGQGPLPKLQPLRSACDRSGLPVGT